MFNQFKQGLLVSVLDIVQWTISPPHKISIVEFTSQLWNDDKWGGDLRTDFVFDQYKFVQEMSLHEEDDRK